METKDLVKQPFANYDVVVYFGCALFSLPIIFHYLIQPFGLRMPNFRLNVGSEFADSAVSTLSLLFSVYILGHMIAYGASYLIEKTVDTVFGKISSSILIASLSRRRDYHEVFQAWIARRLREAFRHRRYSTTFRILLLAPVLPAIILLFATKSFDYFKTRIPLAVLRMARRRAEERGYGAVGLNTQWYKAVEHDVINNNPAAVSRMYNYLVIRGLFRSLAFVFLFSSWSELALWGWSRIDGKELAKPIMSDQPLYYSHFVTLSLFNIVFIFSLSAYVKFARRYAEETIFAFALTKPLKAEPESPREG